MSVKFHLALGSWHKDWKNEIPSASGASKAPVVVFSSFFFFSLLFFFYSFFYSLFLNFFFILPCMQTLNAFGKLYVYIVIYSGC